VHNKLYRNSFPTFIDLVNKGNYTQFRMCAMHKDCMLHQANLSNLVLYMNPMLEHQQLFIAKYVSCKAHPWSPIFQDIVGHFLSHVLHDLSSLESTPVMLPHSAPMRLPLHPRFAPWSHDLGRLWLPLARVLHAHLAAPSASSCFVSCWVTSMPWTVLRPSFRSCQVEPLTCTSCCALLNLHLRAGCQVLRCRIRI